MRGANAAPKHPRPLVRAVADSSGEAGPAADAGIATSPKRPLAAPATLEQVVRAIVREEIRQELAHGELEPDPWIDQEHSALGRKQHCRVVHAGKLEGSKVGRKVLVRRSKLDAFIEAHRVTPGSAADPNDVDAVLDSLGFRGPRRRP